MTIIRVTIQTASRESTMGHDAMDDKIHAGIAHAGKLGGDLEAEFNRKHRVRRPPRRINDNPDSQATLTMSR